MRLQKSVRNQFANSIASVSVTIDTMNFHKISPVACFCDRSHHFDMSARSVGFHANSRIVVKIETTGAHGNAGKKNPATKYSNITADCPLARRVVAGYSVWCAVCPAQGIGTPKLGAPRRAERLFRRGFLWSGVLREPSGSPLAPSGSSNRGTSGHQHWDAGVGRSLGDRL